MKRIIENISEPLPASIWRWDQLDEEEQEFIHMSYGVLGPYDVVHSSWLSPYYLAPRSSFLSLTEAHTHFSGWNWYLPRTDDETLPHLLLRRTQEGYESALVKYRRIT